MADRAHSAPPSAEADADALSIDGDRNVPRQVTRMLAGVALLTMATVATGLWWTVQHSDRLAQRDAVRLAGAAYQSLQQRLDAATLDYAWWQDAYEAVRDDDAAWIYGNLGAGTTKGSTFDLMVVAQPDRPIRYGWRSGGAAAPDPEVIPERIVRSIAALLRDVPVSPVEARSGFAWIDGYPTILSAARISPFSFEGYDPASAPVLVTGSRISRTVLADKARETLLTGLAMERADAGAGAYAADGAAARGALAILGLRGTVAGRLTWTMPRPSRAILAGIAPAVAGLAALFLFVLLLVARRARRQARRIVQQQRRAIQAAHTDKLTGLLNRTGLADAERGDAVSEALGSGRLALIYLDLNGFKLLNDRVGHDGGDEALRAVARRLRGSVRRDDIVARVGGDEFVVLIVDGAPVETARTIVRRLSRAMAEPIIVNGRPFSTSVSAGIASDAEADSIEEMTANADAAMYVAKETGTHEGVVYRNDMSAGREERKRIEARLRQAIAATFGNDSPFRLVYQPIIDAAQDRLVGAEALLRWTDAELGEVPPAKFIPVAETFGLVPDLGRFVIETACADMALWPDLAVSINVSALQLRDPAFADETARTARSKGIDPERLTLEITESALIDAPEIARVRMEELRAHGFPLALDDFGTGFSSIGYLRRFRFDKLKIDRSFVTPLGADANANMLFQSLVKLSEAFGLRIVAEGVETVEQDRMVRLAGCTIEQGFLHARPMPFGQMQDWQASRDGTAAVEALKAS